MGNLPTPLEEIKHPLLDKKSLKLFVKRDDLIHPEIMGNKWRKLKYNLIKMKEDGLESLVTLGGAYSNHIAATAAAANEFGIKAVGIIRGEELNANSNETLRGAHSNGMKLKFVDRVTYREWRENPQQIKEAFPNHYYLPEGGTNSFAIKGCEEIIHELENTFDVIACPIGTGGTFAGLVKATEHLVLGVSVLKGSFIHQEVKNLLCQNDIFNNNYQIIDDAHFGGYGKTTGELIDFINWFKENFGILLDPIYTGKSFFTVWNMIKTDKFEKNLEIVLLHTGGLQGITGFNRKSKNIIQ